MWIVCSVYNKIDNKKMCMSFFFLTYFVKKSRHFHILIILFLFQSDILPDFCSIVHLNAIV